jgi:hypothetical protein
MSGKVRQSKKKSIMKEQKVPKDNINYDKDVPFCESSTEFDEAFDMKKVLNDHAVVVDSKYYKFLDNIHDTTNKSSENNHSFSTQTLSITTDGLIKSTRKKIAIVGSASSSLHLAPYDDYSFDIMGLGWRQDLRRVDILIDVHKMDQSRIHVPQNYHEYLKAKNIPVYTQEVVPDIPNSIRFPIEIAITKFGDYFASSVAYAVAIAIMSGYEEIFLVGIDMLCDSEYEFQRPNCEYLLGYARGAGINVRIPMTSALLKFDHRYGYDKEPENDEVLSLIENSIKGYTESYEDGRMKAVASDGAKQAMQKLYGIIKNRKRGMINV